MLKINIYCGRSACSEQLDFFEEASTTPVVIVFDIFFSKQAYDLFVIDANSSDTMRRHILQRNKFIAKRWWGWKFIGRDHLQCKLEKFRGNLSRAVFHQKLIIAKAFMFAFWPLANISDLFRSFRGNFVSVGFVLQDSCVCLKKPPPHVVKTQFCVRSTIIPVTSKVVPWRNYFALTML